MILVVLEIKFSSLWTVKEFDTRGLKSSGSVRACVHCCICVLRRGDLDSEDTFVWFLAVLPF